MRALKLMSRDAFGNLGKALFQYFGRERMIGAHGVGGGKRTPGHVTEHGAAKLLGRSQCGLGIVQAVSFPTVEVVKLYQSGINPADAPVTCSTIFNSCCASGKRPM